MLSASEGFYTSFSKVASAFPDAHGMRDKVQEGKYLVLPAVLKVLSTGGMASSPCTEGIRYGGF